MESLRAYRQLHILEDVRFEWDPKKNRANNRRHGIDFADAIAIFGSPCVEGPDDRYNYGEERMIAYGQMGPHVVVVVFSFRNGRRRIISARKATRAESKAYWEIVYGNR